MTIELWQARYTDTPPFPYGNTATYELAADFLHGCRTIEDRGCGAQWFQSVMATRGDAVVTGIDGSAGLADIVADLATYQPGQRPDGILMRHVLEHCHNWRDVLANALESFANRMVLVLFITPAATETNLYDYEFPTGGIVPNIALPYAELIETLRRAGAVEEVTMLSPGTEFNRETVFKIVRHE